MRPHDHTVKRRQVHRSATIYLQEHVPLSDYKREVTASMLWAVLLTAAVEVTSIHATCPRLADLPEGRLTKARALCGGGLGRQGPLSQNVCATVPCQWAPPAMLPDTAAGGAHPISVGPASNSPPQAKRADSMLTKT